METAEQRQARIERLEEQRAARRGDQPPVKSAEVVEVAPGRGDLTRSSVPVGPSEPLLSPWIPAVNSSYVSTVDGKQVSFARLFATQPLVATCVMRLLTWSVRVPLKAYQRTGEDSRRRLRPDDHPVAAAIARPRVGAYPARLTMDLLGPLFVHGNSITEVDEGAGGAIMFEPHDWRTTKPIKATPSSWQIDGWQTYDEMGQTKRPVSANNVVHIAWWSPLGPEGVSPLQQLGVTISIDEAAQRYQKAQFKNGARPPSAVEATVEFLGLPGPVRDALLEQLREDITLLYSGPDNGGRPALLPPGLQWKPVGHTSVEAELIDQRYISREEGGSVYQIPLPFIGDLRHATYSNIRELLQVAYTDGLGPPCVLAEQALTAIFQELLRDPTFYVEFDFAGVLRGDFLKEVNAIRLAIGSGMLTPNEGRAIQNRERSDEPRADQLWMPWNNLQPMDSEPPQNRATRRQQQRDDQQAAWREESERGKATLFVAESWRSKIQREDLEAAVAAPAAEHTDAEEVLAA
jgi:HK97 family phage portal protein